MAEVPEIKDLCNKLKEDTKKKARLYGPLTLASLKIGNDYSSGIYSKQQQKLAGELGINYRPVILRESSSFDELCEQIKGLNRDDEVTGILVNKPFPRDWKEEEVFSRIDSSKDIEGLSPYNLGMLFMDKPRFISPTVRSILKFLEISGGFSLKELCKKDITIIGASVLVGKPLTIILSNLLATVSLTHIGTYNNGRLPFYVKNADIVISAAGEPDLIRGEWIKKGAVVIDVGTGQKDGKICGDVEFKSAARAASFITPVPGGVGKLTTIFLFRNLIKAARINKYRL